MHIQLLVVEDWALKSGATQIRGDVDYNRHLAPASAGFFIRDWLLYRPARFDMPNYGFIFAVPPFDPAQPSR